MQDEIDGEDAYTPGRTISGDGSELPTAAAAAEGEGGEGGGGGDDGGGGGGGGGLRRYADHFYWPHFAILAQLPATALPAGRCERTGLPVGVQVRKANLCLRIRCHPSIFLKKLSMYQDRLQTV